MITGWLAPEAFTWWQPQSRLQLPGHSPVLLTKPRRCQLINLQWGPCSHHLTHTAPQHALWLLLPRESQRMTWWHSDQTVVGGSGLTARGEREGIKLPRKADVFAGQDPCLGQCWMTLWALTSRTPLATRNFSSHPSVYMVFLQTHMNQ